MAIEAARLFVKVGSDTREGERGLSSFNDKLNNSARTLATVGGVMTAGVTLPLVAIGKSALDMAGDYEQSMNILRQVSGATAAQMEALNQQALQLGADTVFSAGEAADGMLELAKAGMDVDSVMSAIPGVMALAAAGNVALTEAAGLTAATLNAFNLEATESNRIADLLAATANASAADISDLGQGMRQAGFAFAMANQPVENLAASLAILTNVGLTGSDAGTALKNAFMRLMNPTQEAVDVMDELSLSFYDAQGVMLPLPAIIDALNEATAGLTNQQRDQALATIFMSDGMKAMIPLMEAGSSGFNTMVDSVTEAGAATDVANARMGGLKGGLEELSGSVESFMIGTAQPFLGILGDLARSAADAVTWFGALPQPVINAALGFAALLAVTGPLLVGMGAIAGTLAALATPFGLVVGGIVLLTAAVGALGAAWTMNLGDIQGKTSAAVAAMTPWFTAMSAQLTTLASSASAAATNLATLLGTAFDKALTIDLSAQFNVAGKLNVDALRDNILSGLASAINGINFGQGSSVFAGLINGLSASIRSLDFSAIDWAGVFTRILLGPIGNAINGIKWLVGSTEFEGLKTAVTGAIDEIQWDELGTAFTGLGDAIVAQLVLLGNDIIADFRARFAPPPPQTEEITKAPEFDFDWEWVGTLPTKLASALSNAFTNFDWGLTGQLMGAVIAIKVKGFINDIGGLIGFAGALEDFDTAWNELQLSIRSEILTGFDLTAFTTAWDALGASIAQGFNEMITGLVATFTGSFSKVADTASMSDTLRDRHAALAFQWPPFPEFTWPAWPEFKWPEFEWPEFKWPEIKPPSWLSGLFGGGGGTPNGGAEMQSGRGGGASKGRASARSGDSGAFLTPETLNWEEYVPVLQWSTFLDTVNWDSFISSLAWHSFVDDVQWNSYIPDMGWGDYVPTLNWSAFVPRLSGGSDTPAATPTTSRMSLAAGTGVWNSRASAAAQNDDRITVIIQNVHLASGMDVHREATKLAREVRKRLR